MPDAGPTFDSPPGSIHASAYTEQDVVGFGVPRGLIRHVPAQPPEALDRIDQIDAMQAQLAAARHEPARGGLGLGRRERFRFQAHGIERAVDPPSNLRRGPATSRRARAVR